MSTEIHSNRSKCRSGLAPTATRLAVLALLGMSLPGWAQQAPAAGNDSKAAPKNELETVVVTATRVSTSLLQTPVAVTAITQDRLTREGVTDVRGLAGTVPNLQFSTGADSGVQIAIRGISSNNFTEIGDPAVGLHVGGLYSPRPQGAMALMFDLEQVEVLRGPQGTLFGRNSTAGAINIMPAKPEYGATYGSAELDLGNLNKRQLNVIQNMGIGENFALRATLMHLTRDSWLNQTQDKTDIDMPEHGFRKDGIPDVDQRRNKPVSKADAYNNKDQWAARLAGRWRITPDLEAALTYEKFQNSGAGEIALKDCAQAAGTRFACPGSQWDVNVNLPGKIDMSIDTVRGGLNWNLSKSSALEYNFAYADQRRSQQTDDDAGYHRLSSQVTAEWTAEGLHPGVWPVQDNSSITLNSKYQSLVQELQYKQRTDSLQYVVGAFWMREKNAIDYAQEFLSNNNWGLPNSQFYNQPNRQIDAKALFGQMDWKFAPTWTATVGGRYSWDSKTDQGGKVFGGWADDSDAYYNGHYDSKFGTPEFRPHNSADLTQDMGPFAGTGAYAHWGEPAQNDHSESWRKFTYRLGLMAQLTPKDMVYSSLSTGYKAGGFGDKDDRCGDKTCVEGPSPQFTFFPYKPETVTNLEFGYKGLMLSNRLSISATAFFSRYKDMQVTDEFFSAKVKPEAGCTPNTFDCDLVKKYQTINVGQVDIPGLELEFDYKPWAGARIGGFFTYINSKVKNYPNFSDTWNCDYRHEMGAPDCPPANEGSDPNLIGRNIYDISGNHLPFSPKYSLGFNFSQKFNFGEGYSVTPWLALKWQDKMYFTLRNLDNAHISDGQKAFTKVDASIKLSAPKSWYAEVYVYNATNKYTKNSAQDGGGFVRAMWNDPRMYGVRVGIDY
ncbi:MAG: TonB-dependent receptor [Paucibacter sp.]|nr:TonB-dependent receptor [Roseateles sp.]